jgi:hypothetical protein
MLEMSVQFRDFTSSVTWTLSHHPVIYAKISATKEPQDNILLSGQLGQHERIFNVPSVISR